MRGAFLKKVELKNIQVLNIPCYELQKWSQFFICFIILQVMSIPITEYIENPQNPINFLIILKVLSENVKYQIRLHDVCYEWAALTRIDDRELSQI